MKVAALLTVLFLMPSLSFAANRVLKSGESMVLISCAAVGEKPNELEKLNQALGRDFIIQSGVQIDAPFSVSAPAYSGVGNNSAGYTWCVAVTLTKK